MVALQGVAVSYERGNPVLAVSKRARSSADEAAPTRQTRARGPSMVRSNHVFKGGRGSCSPLSGEGKARRRLANDNGRLHGIAIYTSYKACPAQNMNMPVLIKKEKGAPMRPRHRDSNAGGGTSRTLILIHCPLVLLTFIHE